jgi:hypothetical protein
MARPTRHQAGKPQAATCDSCGNTPAAVEVTYYGHSTGYVICTGCAATVQAALVRMGLLRGDGAS